LFRRSATAGKFITTKDTKEHEGLVFRRFRSSVFLCVLCGKNS
jgi:hypothetical protein